MYLLPMCPTEFVHHYLIKVLDENVYGYDSLSVVEQECAFEYFIVSFRVMTNNCDSVNNYKE